MTLRPFTLFAVAACALLFAAGPAAAADSAPLVAGYWDEFYDHWSGVVKQQNGVVMLTLVIGAVCLFIITRGKWQK